MEAVFPSLSFVLFVPLWLSPSIVTSMAVYGELLDDFRLEVIEHRLLVGVFENLRHDLLGRLVAPTGAVLEIIAGRLPHDKGPKSGRRALRYGGEHRAETHRERLERRRGPAHGRFEQRDQSG